MTTPTIAVIPTRRGRNRGALAGAFTFSALAGNTSVERRAKTFFARLKHVTTAGSRPIAASSSIGIVIWMLSQGIFSAAHE